MTKKRIEISPGVHYLIDKFERKYGTKFLRLIQLLILAFVVYILASAYTNYKNPKKENESARSSINIQNNSGTNSNSKTKVETKIEINGETVKWDVVEE